MSQPRLPGYVPGRFDNRTTAEVEATRSSWNKKPFRTKAQKAEARDTARKVDGRFVSAAPVSFHGKPKADE